MGRIILVLLSGIDEHVLLALKQGLERAFNRSVEVRVKVGKIEHAYDPRRGQYLSPRLLSRLRRMKKEPSKKPHMNSVIFMFWGIARIQSVSCTFLRV